MTRRGPRCLLADAVFDEIGDNFAVHDLTTPGSFWLNPPLPMDEFGRRYGFDPNAPEDMFWDVDPP